MRPLSVLSIRTALGRLLAACRRGLARRATGALAWEHRELENIFALLLLSPLLGGAAVPAPLALDLLPELERELTVLLDRARSARDPLGELFGTFDVE